MPLNVSPSHWIANWSEDDVDITVPLASLTGLTAAEADGTDGDIRKVLFSLLETLYDVWAAEAAADLPTGMRVYKQTGSTGNENVKRTFVLEFHTTSTDEDVASESDIL